MQIAPPTYCNCNNIFFDMNFIQVLNPNIEVRESFLKYKMQCCIPHSLSKTSRAPRAKMPQNNYS